MVQLERTGDYVAQAVQEADAVALSGRCVKCINDKLKATQVAEIVDEVDAAARLADASPWQAVNDNVATRSLVLDDSIKHDWFLGGVGPVIVIVIIVVRSATPAAPVVIIVIRSAAAPAATTFKWSVARIVFVLLHRLVFLDHFTAHLVVVLVDRSLIVEHLSHGLGEVLIGPTGS